MCTNDIDTASVLQVKELLGPRYSTPERYRRRMRFAFANPRSAEHWEVFNYLDTLCGGPAFDPIYP